MSRSFHLTILTPQKTVFEGEVVSLMVPGECGYLGVLAGHAPLISSLAPGVISFRSETGQLQQLTIQSRGFLEVSSSKAHVLLTSYDESAPVGASVSQNN